MGSVGGCHSRSCWQSLGGGGVGGKRAGQGGGGASLHRERAKRRILAFPRLSMEECLIFFKAAHTHLN